MNRLILAACVALLLSTTAAFAGPGGHGNGHGKQEHQRSHAAARVEHHGNRHAAVHREWRRDGHRTTRHYARHTQDWKAAGLHDNGRHLGQRRHAWERGQRLPTNYLDQRYYVNDYATYHLTQPPAGYQWVRPYPDNNRYYLVQTVTGLISQILGGR